MKVKIEGLQWMWYTCILQEQKYQYLWVEKSNISVKSRLGSVQSVRQQLFIPCSQWSVLIFVFPDEIIDNAHPQEVHTRECCTETVGGAEEAIQGQIVELEHRIMVEKDRWWLLELEKKAIRRFTKISQSRLKVPTSAFTFKTMLNIH